MEVVKGNMEIKGLYKKFDDLELFKDFSISFNEGEITCFLGPSGCGKTTLLNIIGRIVSPDNGIIEGFSDKNISYIFQDPSLIPWKTVRGNIDFVIDRGMTPVERLKVTERLLKLVELEEFADYYPAKLSGGMRQRVSIARAFAYSSDVILMDEPFKGLDIKLKLNLIQTFSHIWLADKRTVIFVTHDVDEALLLSNEIFVFSHAPVQIIAQQKVDIPLEGRSPDSEYIQELKQILVNLLVD
ncbi:MAG: ABC transporter ATP-binding protein [Bacteroidales bacterium]